MTLANYACQEENSRERFFEEKQFNNNLSAFQRDRYRVIHSMAFRRLEYKTQVFMNYLGDHYRTRLTHSLEVSQVARVIAKQLDLNEDLADIIALSHDLGHPPFGHAGEEALARAAADFGGFDHNAQTLKIVLYLEKIYAEFDGLNLTWESIEGIAKHNGPVIAEGNQTLDPIYAQLQEQYDIDLNTYASLEAQAAALADDIAYCNHDIDDGIRAGFITLEDLDFIPELQELFSEVKRLYPKAPQHIIINEGRRRLMKLMIDDLVSHTQRNIKTYGIKSIQDARQAGVTIVTFSPEMVLIKCRIKAFLMQRVYRHYTVNRVSRIADKVVTGLFNIFMESPNCLPKNWQTQTNDVDMKTAAEVVKNYIAGMTDRYAIKEYKRLTDTDILINN
jgi:dGTPase